MELDDFKQAWNKLSAGNEPAQYNLKEIESLLKKRTLSIAEKIGRNIRIGIGIILAWILFCISLDFLSTPLFNNYLDKPYITDKLMFWTYMLEAINYTLILTAIIIFWIRYSKIEKQKNESLSLKDQLISLIKVLSSYKVMFYIALTSVLFYVIASFSSGFFLEYQYQISQSAVDLSQYPFLKWVAVILSFSIVLGIILIVYYLLFNLFFKRLYGRYLEQLKATLRELNESHS